MVRFTSYNGSSFACNNGAGGFRSKAIYDDPATSAAKWNKVNISYQWIILTFDTAKNLSMFSQGTPVKLSGQEGVDSYNVIDGYVWEVDTEAKTLEIVCCGCPEQWTPGKSVTYVNSKFGSGTVESVNLETNTVVLTDINGAFADPDEETYQMESKYELISDSWMYCVFGADGEITSLTPQDPDYVKLDNTQTLTPVVSRLKFPLVFPTGKSPDTDIQAGSQFYMKVEASNGIEPNATSKGSITPS